MFGPAGTVGHRAARVEAGVGSVVAVVGPPVFDSDLGFEEGFELFDIEQLVSEPAAE